MRPAEGEIQTNAAPHNVPLINLRLIPLKNKVHVPCTYVQYTNILSQHGELLSGLKSVFQNHRNQTVNVVQPSPSSFIREMESKFYTLEKKKALDQIPKQLSSLI